MSRYLWLTWSAIIFYVSLNFLLQERTNMDSPSPVGRKTGVASKHLTFRTRASASRAFWSCRTDNAFSRIANEIVRWPRRGFRTIRSLQSPRRSQRTDRMPLQRLADGDDSVW